MGMRDGITIGDLAERCGVSRDTLRFYERERLLAPPRRTASGYRLYGETDEARVRFIRRAQATGLTLDDVRELLRVQPLRTPEACRRVAERLRERIAALDRKVEELAAFRRELARAVARCEEGAESCPVILRFEGDEAGDEEPCPTAARSKRGGLRRRAAVRPARSPGGASSRSR